MAVDLAYPVRYDVEYPDRKLDRLSTFLRPFYGLPILIVLASLGAASFTYSNGSRVYGFSAGGAGLLVIPPLLMILFRRKYPRWWFDWNLEFLRFANRVYAYLGLLSDRYPSTDEHQYVRLEIDYPDARSLNRWLPLVKWFLAIPHWIVLTFLWIAAWVVLVFAWFAILFTGRFPRSMFDFVVGVARWHNRVVGYALVMATDRYPPFALR